MECLLSLNLLLFRILSQDRSQRSGLKRFNLQFSLWKKKTWKSCCLCSGRKVIPIKWVFKRKTDAEGEV